MYAEDSFHTLSFSAQLGLLAVSAVLSVTLVVVAISMMRRRRNATRLTIAALMFFVFVWVSPQIYYEYYQWILSDLPRQWVIDWPPTVAKLWGFITFTGPKTISAHSLGVLFWVLICLAEWFRKAPRAATAPDPER